MAKKAKNRKTKLPFAVLRKGALCAMLGVATLAGGLLVGCDEESGVVAGPTNVNFYYGTASPTPEQNPGKVGDFYIETDVGDIWQLKDAGWIKISNLKGPQGAPGRTPTIEITEDGYWKINGVKSEVKAEGEKGEAPEIEVNAEGFWTIGGVPIGVKAQGEEGKSAFDLAVEHEDFEGTVEEWLESLKGEQGERGYYVTAISEKVDDKWGISSHFEFTLNDKDQTVVSTESVSRLTPNYYYGATTGADILELIELGAENIQLENDVELTSSLAIEHNLSIDLNNHKLTYTDGTQIVIDAGIEVEFKDGEMDFNATSCSTSSLKVLGGSSLVLDSVDYVSKGTNVMVIEDATSVKIVDSHLTGAGYCVGTNALTEQNFGVQIEIDDCEFNTTSYEWGGEEWFDTTPILINIPCTASIKDSKITGHRQAVIVRGGDVVIENCTLISTGKDYTINGLGLTYNTGAWGTGNAVPLATLVAGNNGTGIYASYATKLDLVDVEVISQKMSLGIPTIWLAGGNAGENGLTVNYSAKQMDESFMYGLCPVGENFVINVEANDYEILRGLSFMASDPDAKIMPKLTRDVLAYGYDISINEQMEVEMVRGILQSIGALEEFDLWTMYDENYVYVDTVEELVLAITPQEQGGLGLAPKNIELRRDIDMDQYLMNQSQGQPLPIEILLEVKALNEQLNGGSLRLEYAVDTHQAMVLTEAGLQAAVNTYGSRYITLLNDIAFEGLGLVIGEGKDVTIDLNGRTISAPNDEVGDGVFHVTMGGRLTIEDHTGAGVVDAECVSEYKMAIWADGGEVIINGGTFTNSSTEGTYPQYDLIYASNYGRITINGGRFDCKTPKWTLNIKNGHKDYTFIIVNAGEFKGYNPSRSYTDENPENDPPSNFVAISSEVHEGIYGEETWYIVTSNMGGDPGVNPEF